MPIFPITVPINVQDRGVLAVRRSLSGLEKQATSVAEEIARRFVITGQDVVRAAQSIVAVADSFTHMQNRLRVVTQGQRDLANATERVFEIANKTRVSVNDTAEAFTRFSLALKDTDATQGEVLRLTESINKAIILSGASSQEASAGLIQFSQGLASGALRGDELRSVLEQLPAVADVIAKQLGVTRGELREMGKDGKITADVIREAFNNAAEDLDAQFGQTVPTIGQSIQVLRNQFIRFIGALQQSTNIFGIVIDVISFFGEALALVRDAARNLYDLFGELVRVGKDVGDSIGTITLIIAGPLVAAIGAAILAAGGLTAALTALAAVNPAIWIAVGVSAVLAFRETLVDATVAVLDFIDSINPLTDEIKTATIAETIWFRNALKSNRLMIERAKVIYQLKTLWADHGVSVRAVADLYKDQLAGALEAASDTLLALGKTVGLVDALTQKEMDDAKAKADSAKEAMKRLRDEFTEMQEHLDPVTKALNDYDEALDLIDRALRAGLIESQDEANALMRAAAKEIGETLEQADLLADAYERLAAVGVLADPSQFAPSASVIEANFAKDFPELVAKEREERAKLSADKQAQALKDIDNAKRLDEIHKQTVEREKAMRALAEDFAKGLTDAIFDADQSLRQFFHDFLENLAKAITQALILKGILAATGQDHTGASPIASLLGFQQGGSFTVGGQGGPDSQIVAFRATPGEHVIVQTPEQRAARSDSGSRQVNVKAVVVANMHEASLEAQRSREGEQVFLEHARNNGLL